MAKSRPIRKYRPAQVPRWLTTYADMVTLLLCLFVMLYATGKATPQEVQLILSAFNNSLGFFSGGQTLSKGRLEELGLNLESLPSKTKGRTLARAVKQARSLFKSELQDKRVRVTEDERGLVISLIGADYFNPGSAVLTPAVQQVLPKVISLVKELNRFIRLEGHSSAGEETSIYNQQDASQGGERLYQNSWDLSSARANNVATFMQQMGIDPSWMQTVGYGSYRPLDIVKPGTPELAAHNRRIDIVLLTFKSVIRKKSESNYGLPKSLIPQSETIIEDR